MIWAYNSYIIWALHLIVYPQHLLVRELKPVHQIQTMYVYITLHYMYLEPTWTHHIWVCLKIGYIPNEIAIKNGIMISKTIGFRGTNHFQTHPFMTSWDWKWFLRVLSGWGDSWYAPHPRFEPGLKIRHVQMCFPTKTYWNLHVDIHLREKSQFLYVFICVKFFQYLESWWCPHETHILVARISQPCWILKRPAPTCSPFPGGRKRDAETSERFGQESSWSDLWDPEALCLGWLVLKPPQINWIWVCLKMLG